MEEASITQEVPQALELLEDSFLVKAIDSFIIAMKMDVSDDKLRRIRCLTQLLKAYIIGGYFTDAILSTKNIKGLKLGKLMTEVVEKEEDKLVIGRLASVILAIKPNVTVS